MSPPPDDGPRARLRVNLQAREFEVEGTEAFVGRYAARIEALLRRLEAGAPAAANVPAAAEPVPEATSFGELLQTLPRAATDVDRMLLAGWFLQRRAAERSFATAGANRLLLEQGVKLGNPSQSVKQNLVAKRAFLVARGRYRVAQVGLGHLEQLTGGRFSDG